MRDNINGLERASERGIDLTSEKPAIIERACRSPERIASYQLVAKPTLLWVFGF